MWFSKSALILFQIYTVLFYKNLLFILKDWEPSVSHLGHNSFCQLDLFLEIIMAEDLDQLILERVDANGSVNTFELAAELHHDHQLFVGAVKRLQSLGEVCCTIK